MPTEIDVVARRIRQLEIERVALEKENDAASEERLSQARGGARRPPRAADGDDGPLAGREGGDRRDPRAEGRARGRPRRGGALRARRRPRARGRDPLRRAARARAPDRGGDRAARRAAVRAADAEGGGRRRGRRRGRRPLDRRARVAADGGRGRRSSSSMEDVLHERVVGQDEAVARGRQRHPAQPRRAVATRTGRSGRSSSSARPASARPSWRGRWRSSCSTTSGRWSASTWASTRRSTPSRAWSGAPPGYVGYEEGGQLTEAVRRRPYSVVLLDEIEKAHPDVFNVLLQVLDDGRLTDGQGRTVDFTNTVLIMTSNLRGDPMDVLQAGVRQPHRRDRPIPRARPRGPRRRSSTSSSTALEAPRRAAARRSRSPTRPRQLLAEHGYDPVFGARPLRRVIQREIGDPLAIALLEGRYSDGDIVTVDAKDDALVLELTYRFACGRSDLRRRGRGARRHATNSPACVRQASGRAALQPDEPRAGQPQPAPGRPGPPPAESARDRAPSSCSASPATLPARSSSRPSTTWATGGCCRRVSFCSASPGATGATATSSSWPASSAKDHSRTEFHEDVWQRLADSVRFVPGVVRRRQRVRRSQRYARRARGEPRDHRQRRLLPVDPARSLPPVLKQIAAHRDGRQRRRRGLAAGRRRETLRSRPTVLQSPEPSRRQGLHAARRLPHRPLPRQGDGPEPAGPALCQHAVRARLELELRRLGADHDGRGRRDRRAGGVLRPDRGGPRRAAEPPASAAWPSPRWRSRSPSTPRRSGPRS